MHESPLSGVDDGDALAKIEVRSQRRDARLAFADDVDRRRLQQPAGQPLLAHRRAAERQQLEHAAGPEDVEIIGIRMIGVLETLAARLGAHPASWMRAAPSR